MKGGKTARASRPNTYVKIKGCYECSRRRISCDRQSPECRKCQLKGLNCSGLGIRYRFNDGLAARGNLVGRTYPLTKRSPDPMKTPYTLAVLLERDSEDLELVKIREIDSSLCLKYRNALLKERSEPADYEDEKTMEDTELTSTSVHNVNMSRELDHLDGRTRHLLSYFSTQIAPILAVIDRGFNGYRDLILPFAESNTVVRNTILIISIEHISTKIRGCEVSTAQLYHDVLRGLHHRSLLHPPQQDHVAMTTFLLLLVREMITVGDRFSRTYTTLRHLIRQGGTDLISSSAVGRFVAIQILRVQLCAASVYSEAEGRQLIQLQLEHCLEYLRLCQSLHPEHSQLMTLLFDLITKACMMYVQRAESDPEYTTTQSLVEQFKQVADLISEYDNVVGWQLLHWPYFIAAAESSSFEHRQYFVKKLRLMHQKTGCQNTAKALSQLETLWAFQPAIRWTSLLGGHAQIFIM